MNLPILSVSGRFDVYKCTSGFVQSWSILMQIFELNTKIIKIYIKIGHFKLYLRHSMRLSLNFNANRSFIDMIQIHFMSLFKLW